MKFVKYHGLGNDYIVIDPADLDCELTKRQITTICHRNYGPGSDGILLGPLESAGCDFRLRIVNPDGSEAEKSGNGLRIFCRYLYDRKLVGNDPFTVETLGGNVTARVHEGGKQITVDMGQASFDSCKIPVEGSQREVLNETILIEDEELTFCAATVGNPHCVVLLEKLSAQAAKMWGPSIETDPRFPNRTNVQFMKVLDRANIQIEIWERGAGYTLASGSSSSAAAAVACKLGLCDNDITVHSPGGTLHMTLTEDFFITMTGPVTKVWDGQTHDEMFETIVA
ncbi:diaminopimelate epimerase [candidate division KSB3 bacterium]|uniref:Diaminopimelate epimerase n=1 Tax=candidate division KSB3 bacterium TaxID=2044937 RepID=A0A2G6KI25_9BACT|nr:MAG: diaminopimelate epimerase [candidate division KSB3 bacterium]